MEALTEFLQLLNSLSPLAVIALLGTVIFMLVTGKTKAGAQIKEVQNNHLHELPEIAETLRRIELKMSEDFAYIKARINGKPNH